MCGESRKTRLRVGPFWNCPNNSKLTRRNSPAHRGLGRAGVTSPRIYRSPDALPTARENDHATRRRSWPAPQAARHYAGGLGAAAIVGAVVPALTGLAFLISLATGRPLIGAAARRWPWLTSYPPGDLPRRTQVGLTAVWGIGLLAAGAVQAADAITGGLTITSPASFTARALIALAVEATLAVITTIWLHRKPAAARPSGTGSTGAVTGR